MRYALALALLLPSALLAGDPPKTVAPGTPVTITVVPGTAPAPAVSITLHDRHGHVTPQRQGCTHTGSGIIDVQQPTPDTVVITMTGAAVATPHPAKSSYASQQFDLNQCFEITFDKPDVKGAKLTVEGRVIGLLRSHKCGKGSAEHARACASLACGEVALLSLALDPHSVAGGENLSVNCRKGPLGVSVRPGKFTLHQTFAIHAAHPWSLLPSKASSAEFAPDPALDPLWISYWEPFHGAQKKDFGFQVTLKVAPE